MGHAHSQNTGKPCILRLSYQHKNLPEGSCSLGAGTQQNHARTHSRTRARTHASPHRIAERFLMANTISRRSSFSSLSTYKAETHSGQKQQLFACAFSAMSPKPLMHGCTNNARMYQQCTDVPTMHGCTQCTDVPNARQAPAFRFILDIHLTICSSHERNGEFLGLSDS